MTSEFILNIHRRIVTGCDDDRCQPGGLRPDGWNVTFGTPRCRGVEGGRGCRAAFDDLGAAIAGDDGNISVNLDWPQQFSESELLERYENMPSAGSTRHPAMAELSRLFGRSRVRTTLGRVAGESRKTAASP